MGKTKLELAYAREKKRILSLSGSEKQAGVYDAPVFGEGPQDARILFVGEAPGAEEAKTGRPFVGRAGRQLDALLSAAGIDRGYVYVTNSIKYRPIRVNAKSAANRTPTRKEVLEGLPLLKLEIQSIHPHILATLGNTPLAAVLEIAGQCPMNIGAVHGRAIPIMVGRTRCLLFPLYHPASVLYNPSLMPILETDLKALAELIEKT